MGSYKTRVVVGLGNPGRGYAHHRHNIGFMVVDELARRAQEKWSTNKEKTLICDIDLEGEKLLLVKPQTYMNLSGKAVAPIVNKLDFDAPSRMIVIHDELDISIGSIKIKVGGGDGGHKGIRSIADSLRFRDFIRLRLGIGRPPTGIPPEEYVLTNFESEYESIRTELIDKACDAVSMIIKEGFTKTQMTFHTRKKSENSGNPE